MFRQLEHMVTLFRLAVCCWLFKDKNDNVNILVPECILNYKRDDYKGFLQHSKGKLDE